MYNDSMKPSLVVIGLGNPGKAYADTRHNIGFMAVDALGEAYGEGEWKDAQKFQSVSCDARILTVPILLIKPHTYMNRSGEAIRKIVDFYKLNPAVQIIVVSDDIDIELGTFRLRTSGGPGTHNGLKSVVEQFGEHFPRLRIGIGPKPATGDLATWVLSALTKEEYKKIDEVFAQLPALLKTFVMERAENGEH